MTAPITSNTLGVNVFTAPGKTMVGERPKSLGEPFGFDPITSTLIFGEYDAVLVDAMGRRSWISDVLRLVRCVRGRVSIQTELIIRFDYGAAIPWFTLS